MIKTKKLKLNVPLRGKPANTVVTVEVDHEGTPIDKFWRNRVKDAKTDNCVEWYKAPKQDKKGDN
jgi:hypothetical protein